MFVSITLDGTPKEIAALVAELQKQHQGKHQETSKAARDLAKSVARAMRLKREAVL